MIYVMAEIVDGAETGLVKIGSVGTDDNREAESRIRNRLIDLQQGNPRQLAVIAMLPGDRIVEKSMHRKFAEQRCKGEWVRVDSRVSAWIERHRLAAAIRFTNKADRWWDAWCGAWLVIAKRCNKQPHRPRRARTIGQTPMRRQYQFYWRGEWRDG